MVNQPIATFDAQHRQAARAQRPPATPDDDALSGHAGRGVFDGPETGTTMEGKLMHATQAVARRDSRAWQSALDRALSAHDSEDALARYLHVAFAFPSRSPNPYSRDYPLLNYQKLKEWATSRGWRVRPAPERAPADEKYSPPVRFTRLPQGGARPGARARHH